MDLLSNLLPNSFQASLQPASTCLEAHHVVFNPLPAPYERLNAVAVNQDLAVIPGSWQSGGTTSLLYDAVPTEPCVSGAFAALRRADFIALDDEFFGIIGAEAKLERIQTFGVDEHHVHEAPVYLPQTNELLYSDTSLVGVLYAINIDTHEIRQVNTNPPLPNVNGATYHRGKVYVATNGGSTRGVFELNITTGRAEAIVNNYRGRHLNSPNDLIFDTQSNLYFTDPPYGYTQAWPGVAKPELPNAIYRFDPRTKALTTLSSGVIKIPNGLALSADERTLYVADSSSSLHGLESQRAIFAFDVRLGGLLSSPRLVYQVDSGWPDGLRVTESGLLVIAVAGGAEFVNPDTGALLGRVNTPGDIIYNLEPARGKGVWLLTGQKHIYKVTIREGPVIPGLKGYPSMIFQSFQSLTKLFR